MSVDRPKNAPSEESRLGLFLNYSVCVLFRIKIAGGWLGCELSDESKHLTYKNHSIGLIAERSLLTHNNCELRIKIWKRKKN